MARATIRSPKAVTVALVVNGVVAGTYELGDDRRGRFVVAESLFRNGPNELEVVMIEGPPGDERLRRFAGDATA